MEKTDLKRELKNMYSSSAKEAEFLEIAAMNFLMIDGEGDPNTSEEFQRGVEELYGLSFTLKFMVKKLFSKDYTVMPLEGLWWMDDMSRFSLENKNEWKWTLMIMQPAPVDKRLVDEAIADVKKKKKAPDIYRARFDCYEEGLAAQILHLGYKR